MTTTTGQPLPGEASPRQPPSELTQPTAARRTQGRLTHDRVS